MKQTTISRWIDEPEKRLHVNRMNNNPIFTKAKREGEISISLAFRFSYKLANTDRKTFRLNLIVFAVNREFCKRTNWTHKHTVHNTTTPFSHHLYLTIRFGLFCVFLFGFCFFLVFSFITVPDFDLCSSTSGKVSCLLFSWLLVVELSWL